VNVKINHKRKGYESVEWAEDSEGGPSMNIDAKTLVIVEFSLCKTLGSVWECSIQPLMLNLST